MRTRHFLFTLGTALALVAGGCDKKDSTTTGPQTNTPPPFPSVTVTGPSTTSSDTYAQTTIAYATAFGALTNPAMFTPFSGQNSVQSGNTWTWTVTAGTLTITFTTTKEADGSYTWSWKQNGYDSSSHTTYVNWVFISGSRSADGKNGEWMIYEDNTTTLSARLTWATNAGGTLTATWFGYTNGVITDKLVIVNNSDKSGELTVYDGTVLIFKSTWIANGSGTWWTYSSSTGLQTGTGTWS
ncbi:MAG TPA: hypothetical protein VI758_08975 [Bacteroidota bacterium]